MRLLLLLWLALPAMCTDMGQRICGGSDASISSYPHLLSLRVAGSHSCGASLIGSTRALTAAHCTGSAIGVYTLLGGTTDCTVTNCATCILRDLTMMNRHPQYDENGPGYPNDVAVLGFAAVSFNSNLQAIALSTPSDGSWAGSTCWIVGCGQTSFTTLQHASMTVLTNTACAGEWGSLNINDGHICVTDSKSSASSGDSGSPLECSNKLVGLSSWGHATCSPAYPSVYTRVSYFYNWIIIQ